jgi:hypothetical protein
MSSDTTQLKYRGMADDELTLSAIAFGSVRTLIVTALANL